MMKESRAVLLLALCAGASLLGSCQLSLRLWVIPDSTAEHLVLGLAESREREEKVRPHSVLVFPCAALKKGAGELTSEAEALWQAGVPQGVSAPPVNRITYGRDEHGLQTTRGPAPLAAGCYAVLAYARDSRDRLRGGTLRVEVTGGGKVIER